MKHSFAGKANPNWRGGLVKRVCEICQKNFEVKQKVVRKGYGKYCSRHCAGIGNGKEISKRALLKRIKKNCVVCNKEILVKPSHERIGGTYCSRKCMAEAYKIRLKGTDNPNYRHGESPGNGANKKRASLMVAANKVGNHTEIEWLTLKATYGYRCANCRKKDSIKPLTRDHILPLSKGGHNGIENIQPLCFRCNIKKHTQFVKYSAQLGIAFKDFVYDESDITFRINVLNKNVKNFHNVVPAFIPLKENYSLTMVPIPRNEKSGLMVFLRPNCQDDEIERLRKVGYEVAVCYSSDEFKSAVKNYLK